MKAENNLSLSETRFMNSDPDQRQQLIVALREKGMEAYEYHSGGGLYHVCVYLLEDDENWLAIATGDAETPCDIGLMGDRNGSQVGDDFSSHPAILAEAVAEITRRWEKRDAATAMYHDGALDFA